MKYLPRPHDTGTGHSRSFSFALHVRAFTGLPVNNITQYGPCASAVILAEGLSSSITFDGVADTLCQPQTQVRLFRKPEIAGSQAFRRLTLTHRDSIENRP